MKDSSSSCVLSSGSGTKKRKYTITKNNQIPRRYKLIKKGDKNVCRKSEKKHKITGSVSKKYNNLNIEDIDSPYCNYNKKKTKKKSTKVVIVYSPSQAASTDWGFVKPGAFNLEEKPGAGSLDILYKFFLLY